MNSPLLSAHSDDLLEAQGLVQAEIARRKEEADRRAQQKLFYELFPDVTTVRPDGSVIHAREQYPKHIEFFKAGKTYRERCFMAANRVGKTVSGAFEVACHLTGEYPDWWEGYRFSGAISAWAAGKTNDTTRDIVQKELLGDVTFEGSRKVVSGTGMIPGYKLSKPSWKADDLVGSIKVLHVAGGWSHIAFKSYQQGRGSFEGTAKHVIWLDEEPPFAVYNECLIRTATTMGRLLNTFTPLEGLTETVMQFMPKEQRPEG